MSAFAKLFGSKKSAPTTQEGLQKLRETQEMLIKKQEYLEKKRDMEIEIAKKHGLKNKRAALQALARKKRYEKQLQQIDGTLTTLESHMEAVDSAGTNVEVMDAMKMASKALKASQKNMNVDDVHNVMDDIMEQHEVAREIADAISQPAGLNADYDEDELMAELEALQEEYVQEKLLDVGPSPSLPAVPDSELPAPSASKKPAKSREEEEAEQLAALTAWSA